MIEVNSLSKRYGDQRVVSDVSFGCEPGTVTGFLGPNGAGKSTTLKMICGLTRPSSGTATVFGVPFAELPNPGARIGVLLDASAQHPARRGRETLGLSGQLIGVAPTSAATMLERVGLGGGTGRKRVGKYSLGMRQRLGVAHALLGDPQALILDEPANGLDPEGMRWMRELLREFADRGGTVLLSSHLLSEIEAIADRLVVIKHGRIVAEGTKQELLGNAVGAVQVRTDRGEPDDRRLADELERRSIAFHPDGNGRLRIDADASSVAKIALDAHVALVELTEAAAAESLEQVFFELTTDASEPQRVAPTGASR